MIIFGTRGVKSTLSQGQFDCPQCGSNRAYKHKKVTRFFTLYFIPVIPLGKILLPYTFKRRVEKSCLKYGKNKERLLSCTEKQPSKMFLYKSIKKPCYLLMALNKAMS